MVVEAEVKPVKAHHTIDREEAILWLHKQAAKVDWSILHAQERNAPQAEMQALDHKRRVIEWITRQMLMMEVRS